MYHICIYLLKCLYVYIYKKVFFHPLDTTLHNQTHLSPQVNFRSAGLPKRIGDQGLTTASKQEKSCKQQRLDNRGFALRWLETHRIHGTWSIIWLVVEPTHLKNIRQFGSFPQIGVKIIIIWNHHLVIYLHEWVDLDGNCR